MKTVTQIFQQVKTISVLGNPEVEISQLTIDSRQVGPQTLFAALKGTQTDGHSYIEKAIELGASAILCEDLPEVIHPTVTYIQVNDSAESLGYASSNFYDNPSSKLKLVGITGRTAKQQRLHYYLDFSEN
jgi:UDP-N-acetylmuramoyl-L-alanyl-D-glutamate--2,6-diaminopimelate ligase